MKAFVAAADAAGRVRMADVPEPMPERNEVVIAVGAYSINRGETFVLEREKDGWRPGKDVAGTVVRVAAEGSGPDLGTRVVGHPASSGWAERVAVPVDCLAILPDHVSCETAAALPLAGLTALRLLRVAGDVAGRRVLMTGASGGVGHYFVELAAAAGAHLTVVTATPERSHRLLALGAQQVVHDISDASETFDVVLESVGGASFSTALSKLAPRRTLIWFGEASRTPATVDFFAFWNGPISGSIRHFDYTDTDVATSKDLTTLVGKVASGRLHPEIGLLGSWTDTPQALIALRDRRVRGNVVLTI